MLENASRTPRGIVLLNGEQICWHDFEVNNNCYYQADTFRVTIPMDAQPPKLTRSWFAAQNPMVVEVYAGFPADPNNFTKEDLELLIIGEVDDYVDRLHENVLALSGRDFSLYLIESKIVVEDAVNKTASDFAIEFAKKYNLKTDYITETTDKVGKIYQLAHTKMQRVVSEWDLLCFFAQEEGFQVFVKGYYLHFEPKAPTAPEYTLEWRFPTATSPRRFDGVNLIFQRSLTLSKDIIVYVRVKSKKKPGQMFTVPARASHTRDKVLNKGRLYSGKPQVVVEVIQSEMTKDAAKKKAYEILANVSRHQVKFTATGIPADSIRSSDGSILMPNHTIKLIGTGDYDQTYHPDSIIRIFDMRSGYTMEITAKNHDTNSETLV